MQFHYFTVSKIHIYYVFVTNTIVWCSSKSKQATFFSISCNIVLFVFLVIPTMSVFNILFEGCAPNILSVKKNPHLKLKSETGFKVCIVQPNTIN